MSSPTRSSPGSVSTRSGGRRAAVVARIRQLVRYGSVSLISTAVSLTVLGALVFTDSVPAGWANVVATAVGTVPSFELNRRWVWGRTGRRSVLAEIGPFCALSFAGLGLSTLAVSLTATWAQTSGLDPAWRTVAVEAANLAAFGSLWVLQFVILDRLLFGRRRPADAPAPPARPPASGRPRLTAEVSCSGPVAASRQAA